MTESTDPMDHQLLAWKFARPYFGMGVDEEDLVQEANVGLTLARNAYDESLGFEFSTYAVPKIRSQIQRYFRDKARLIRVPAHVTVAQRRGLTSDSPGLAPGIRASLLAAERLARRTTIRLNGVTGSTGDEDTAGMSIGNLIPCPQEDEPEDDRRLDAVMAAIRRLPSREADVIRKRYGLDGRDPMVLAEIAAEYGLTHQMLSRIHGSAIATIRSLVTQGDEKR